MTNALKPVLARLATGETLAESEAESAFSLIMDGQATGAQIGAMLMAMRVRGETVPEMAGAVRAMRARMLTIAAPEGAIDVCGTGGDHAGTLNISTAAAFVVAGCGVPVAKHGNRALSSRSGGSDVLTALGVDINAPFAILETLLARDKCCFLFAPRHHSALRHAASARAELGTRTIFNLLGPLSNPAAVKRQFIGVFAPEWARPIADTLRGLGMERLWVVHGQGLDELTLSGSNQVLSFAPGQPIEAATVTAFDAGLEEAPLDAIRGGDADFNAAAMLRLLNGEPGPYRDTVVLNSAGALIAAGKSLALREAAALAQHSIDSGAAFQVLQALRRDAPIPAASG
jgi:anthranilate phosphoribosyltransferase